MKTKNIIMAFAFAAFSVANINAQTSKVNTEQSTIGWIGKKIGGQHEGSINVKSGSIELKRNNIIAGNFTIDMSTISCSDLKDAGYNQKLVGHLKSDDFFGVAKFPTASLVITKATSFKDNKASVTGNLSIKGKTEKITFEVMKGDNAYRAKNSG